MHYERLGDVVHCVFYKTNDVFEGEELLVNCNVGCDIVPTPVQDKAYCGVCIRVGYADQEIVKRLFCNFEFKLIE